MPLYKSLIFLFLLLVSSSLILPFKYSLFFLNILLVLRLKFCRLSPLIWFGFCSGRNFVQQSPSWEASFVQLIKKATKTEMRSQMNSVHILTPQFFKIHFNIILTFTPIYPYWPLPFILSEWNFILIFISAISATCPIHVILFHLITLTMCGEGSKLWSCSVWPLLHPHINFSPLGSNIRLSTLFSSMFSLFFPHLGWDNRIHTHAKRLVKLCFCLFRSLRFRIGDGKTKDSELNGGKRSPNLICSYSLHQCNSDLLLSFPNLHFATFLNDLLAFSYYDFVPRSDD